MPRKVSASGKIATPGPRAALRGQRGAQPATTRTLSALRRQVQLWRGKGERIALVPTMGALHDGHLSLMQLARKHADRVIVSIFVNPAQFAPHEDFAAYPRTLPADLKKLIGSGADLVWAPSVQTMYPEGFATRIELVGPALAGLEDRFRPHFFGGVATVVGKLFLQCVPDVAIFGEKDFQQLMVVRQMARDLDLNLKIIGAKVMREEDGLAMSSRNVYLSSTERARAPALHAALRNAARAIRNGEKPGAALATARRAIAKAGFVIDYVEAREAASLKPLTAKSKGRGRLLAAAKLGTTRLIDNVAI